MRDYRDTLILPQTNFPLQNGQFKRNMHEEPFKELIDIPSKKNVFFLHSGPPYANGSIHLGHALNIILKDMIGKTRYSGFQPGWDCHGLPIEWAVERKIIEEGKTKTDLSVFEFRQRCREFAQEWVDKQRKQFMNLNIMADWSNPYLTMDYKTESKIVGIINKIAQRDLLYKGTKPVLWSIVEETALAEAETEHKDIKSSQIWVRFPVNFIESESSDKAEVYSFPIWTTTPWSLPANLAIAYNSKLIYNLYKVVEVLDGSKCFENEHFYLAEGRADAFANEVGVKLKLLKRIYPSKLDALHPFSRIDSNVIDGWPKTNRWGEVALIHGDHVTDTMGTGFVHIAPEHGPEDFNCWHSFYREQKEKEDGWPDSDSEKASLRLEEYENVVNSDGSYVDDMPFFGGMKILQQTQKGEYIFEFTNAKIITELEKRGALIKASKFVHSYPHSWRSKAPLIYSTTPQWFINVNSIRTETLAEIDNIHFIPEHSKNRFRSALETRPDWLISRQRVWGTPLALFVHKKTGAILKNVFVENRLLSTIENEGGDAWWKYDNEFWFAGTGINPTDYEKIMDVLDVWFDSGCSLFFDEWQQADVYIEGSDQHRGYFGSSMLINMAVKGCAPFKTLITHGFVLTDGPQLQKMSKSAGNGLSPEEICDKYGSDVLRLWIAMSDYVNDVKISEQSIKTAFEILRRFRNTFRYLLGNLKNYPFHPNDQYPELEKYILMKLYSISALVKKANAEYNFKEACKLLMDFCSTELSAFYFDVRKDVLYCDPESSPTRIACTNTLHLIFFELRILLAPFIPCTLDEVSHHRTITNKLSDFFINRFAHLKQVKSDVDWPRVFEIMDMVKIKIEQARMADIIRGDLEAKVTLKIPDIFVFDKIDAAEIFRVSQVELIQSDDTYIEVNKADGNKCARSWKILPTVGSNPNYPDLTPRDAEAVSLLDNRNQKHSMPFGF